MKRLTYLLCLCMMSLMSCVETDVLVEEVIDITNPNPVIFADLTPGQASYYLRYELDCSDGSTFRYTGDTLVLGVVEENDTTYFQEYFTPNSPFYTAGQVDTLRYAIHAINEKQVTLPDRFSSALFFFYGNDTLTIKPDHREPVTQSDCLLMLGGSTLFEGDEIGHLKEFRLGPVLLRNKTAVSCIPVFFSLEAYLIYDEEQLYMSHVVNTADLSGGWLLLQ